MSLQSLNTGQILSALRKSKVNRSFFIQFVRLKEMKSRACKQEIKEDKLRTFRALCYEESAIFPFIIFLGG